MNNETAQPSAPERAPNLSDRPQDSTFASYTYADNSDDLALQAARRRRRAKARRRTIIWFGVVIGFAVVVVFGTVFGVMRYRGTPNVPDATKPLVGRWVRVWPVMSGDVVVEMDFRSDGKAVFTGRGADGRVRVDMTAEVPYSYDPVFRRITVGPIIGPDGPKLFDVSVQQLTTAELVTEMGGQKEVFRRK